MKKRFLILAACAPAVHLIISPLAVAEPKAGSKAGQGWLSPAHLVAAPDGAQLYVACATGQRVITYDLSTRRIKATMPLPGAPTGMALSADGKLLYVTIGKPRSEVCVLDTAKGKIKATLAAGHTAMAPVLSPDGETLFVCNRFDDDIGVLDLKTGRALRRIPVKREPVAAAITPDGRRLLVANHLHNGRADADYAAATVSVIDTEQGRVIDELWLPNGSGCLNDIRISPDGRFAVVTHILARFHLPTTQLDRGWMNTNAKTIIALDRMTVLNTVLLDTVNRGAANPWGAAWSADGQTLVVTHAGSHELSVVKFPALIDKLSKFTPEAGSAAIQNIPNAYASASRTSADVPNDLAFLVGLRERRSLATNDLGPRSVVVVGRNAYVANYFSDTLTRVELDGTYPKVESLPLGAPPEMSPERQGELYFHDARICFQSWQSCASCHPGDARVDALNWDLLNDGIGNPKNNKSLLLVHQTPPAMSTGVRESAETAVRAGIERILFTVQPPEVPAALDDYLKSLKPVPSPRLVKGKLSPAAKRGEKLFRSQEVGCAKCHPGPLFTDLKTYDVGTKGAYDREHNSFDTPTLVEGWRTAPYLHDGSAATMRDVLTTNNTKDEHGKTSHLTADQLSDLCEYLLSL